MSTIKLRCAVYTRKSTEEGLDQEFNSLDAQREACEAYILSQASLGWCLVSNRYDDGGLSGGTMERPALQRLLVDVRERKVDVVVVYKIDRLTRSLTDFSKIVEVFEDAGASFVSVTQQFNTTTSMGRLTLNVLLSFAQFEREIAAERIRDKIAASKKKGMWMGGTVPTGYRVENRKLIVDPGAAENVRMVFRRYLELGSVPALVDDLALPSTLAAQPADVELRPSRWTKGKLYYLLSNPIYVGNVRHRNMIYKGEHEAILDQDLFDRVQLRLKQASPARLSANNVAGDHLLAGILFDEAGRRLSPVFTTNHGKRYRYYVGTGPNSRDRSRIDWRLPAAQLEAAVESGIMHWLDDGVGIAAALDELSLPADQISLAVHRARASANPSGGTADNERRKWIRNLLSKVTVEPNQIRLLIDLRRLAVEFCGESASGEIQDGQTSSAAARRTTTHEVVLQMRLRRRGVESRIVIEGSAIANQQTDATLVTMIARAHLILDRLTDGSGVTLARLASETGLHVADLSRILPLAFLSPALTGAILSGRQPTELTARRLSRLRDFPSSWAQQARAWAVSGY